eukprot:scaffold57073_cov67-Cyclotella_meneghiniana.AAC.1
MKLEFENESTDVKIDTDMEKFFAEELAIIEMKGYRANPKLKGDNGLRSCKATPASIGRTKELRTEDPNRKLPGDAPSKASCYM